MAVKIKKTARSSNLQDMADKFLCKIFCKKNNLILGKNKYKLYRNNWIVGKEIVRFKKSEVKTAGKWVVVVCGQTCNKIRDKYPCHVKGLDCNLIKNWDLACRLRCLFRQSCDQIFLLLPSSAQAQAPAGLSSIIITVCHTSNHPAGQPSGKV